MKTTNFEAETWFQRPETPSRVLEPLGTKVNLAAYQAAEVAQGSGHIKHPTSGNSSPF